MQRFITLAIVGLFAQLVDGALGMGYGATSASLLLTAGLAPAAASATVHMAEVVTTIASGTAHWRFGNVDRRITIYLALPGAVGAFLGAVAISLISAAAAKPFIAVFLFMLGLSILLRFVRTVNRPAPVERPIKRAFLMPLGLVGGFCDASGGGGWGPIATTTLLSREQTAPRKVIGSVDTSEILVASSATLGFLLVLGWEAINPLWVGALILGGVIAAPLAAWLVRILPTRMLGVLAALTIMLTNARILITAEGLSGRASAAIYLGIVAFWGIVVGFGQLRRIAHDRHMALEQPVAFSGAPSGD
jgi:uncharacterized membrane protein YfcA